MSSVPAATVHLRDPFQRELPASPALLPAEPTPEAAPRFSALLRDAMFDVDMGIGLALHETPARRVPPPATAERIDKAAAEMEALFVSQMLKEMWKTVPETTFGMQGTPGEIYRDMYIDNMAELISQGPGIGLKAVLREQLLQSEAGIQPKLPDFS